MSMCRRTHTLQDSPIAVVVAGCAGPMAARLSVMRAARQLAIEANVHIHVRNFQVINQVGAASIDARLDCDAFASTHSSTSHYDRASFVGLAWRPPKESICCGVLFFSIPFTDIHTHTHTHTGRFPPTPINARGCAEIYATGRANLPGSTRERSMLQSFARMLPELLRHSTRMDVFEGMPQHLKDAHRPRAVERDDAPLVAVPAVSTTAPKASKAPKLFALWDEAHCGGGGGGGGEDGDAADAAEAFAMFASTTEDDMALLEGAGF